MMKCEIEYEMAIQIYLFHVGQYTGPPVKNSPFVFV